MEGFFASNNMTTAPRLRKHTRQIGNERVEFAAGTPRLKSSSSRGRCCLSTGLMPSYQSHFPVGNVKLLPGNEKLPIVSPFSAASLLSRKVISLHPFSIRMVSIFPLPLCSALWPQWNRKEKIKKKKSLLGALP